MFAEGSCRSLQFLKHTAGVDVRHHYRHGCRVDTPILQRGGHFTIGHLGRSTHLGLAGLPWWGGKDYMFHVWFVREEGGVWNLWYGLGLVCPSTVFEKISLGVHFDPIFPTKSNPMISSQGVKSTYGAASLEVVVGVGEDSKVGFRLFKLWNLEYLGSDGHFHDWLIVEEKKGATNGLCDIWWDCFLVGLWHF